MLAAIKNELVEQLPAAIKNELEDDTSDDE